MNRLLVSALLLAGSIRHLLNVPLGFNPTGVTTFRVDPPGLATQIPFGELLDRELSEWDCARTPDEWTCDRRELLAAVGLYGVVAFSVAQRLREFGVRLALGATPSMIVRLVLRRTTGVAVAGLLFGLGGALALVRAIESRLVGVDRFEPALWAAAAAGLIVVVFLASIIPARRATRRCDADAESPMNTDRRFGANPAEDIEETTFASEEAPWPTLTWPAAAPSARRSACVPSDSCASSR